MDSAPVLFYPKVNRSLDVLGRLKRQVTKMVFREDLISEEAMYALLLIKKPSSIIFGGRVT
jgi:hypothetical protein